MTDKEKLQSIKIWVDGSIAQGNAPVVIYAIRDILNQKEEIQSPIKLSEKSLNRLKEKKEKLK